MVIVFSTRQSWLQPIELVWARIKHAVARQAIAGRKWQETAEQTRVALRDVTPELCKDLIAHTHKLMNEWLKTSHAGSLQAHGSIDALRRLTPKQREACTDLKLAEDQVTGDVNDDKENQPPEK